MGNYHTIELYLVKLYQCPCGVGNFALPFCRFTAPVATCRDSSGAPLYQKATLKIGTFTIEKPTSRKTKNYSFSVSLADR
jgi:hypothetical protein